MNMTREQEEMNRQPIVFDDEDEKAPLKPMLPEGVYKAICADAERSVSKFGVTEGANIFRTRCLPLRDVEDMKSGSKKFGFNLDIVIPKKTEEYTPAADDWKRTYWTLRAFGMELPDMPTKNKDTKKWEVDGEEVDYEAAALRARSATYKLCMHLAEGNNVSELQDCTLYVRAKQNESKKGDGRVYANFYAICHDEESLNEDDEVYEAP